LFQEMDKNCAVIWNSLLWKRWKGSCRGLLYWL